MSRAPPWLVDLPACASTNTWALDHLGELHHGSVVLARVQTAGRGRDGRIWQAPPGTLCCSIVVAGADPAAAALCAGLACVHAVADLMPAAAARLAIKWPNDVLLDRRKLAGVLCEGRDGRLVIGIGLNRAADLPGELRAASLHGLGTPPAAEDLLVRIRSYLLEGLGLCAARGLAPLLPQVRERDALLGRSLTVAIRGGRLEGVGAGIDEAGRLLVVVPGGGVAVVEAGHIETWA